MSPTINVTNAIFTGSITYEDVPPTQPPPEGGGDAPVANGGLISGYPSGTPGLYSRIQIDDAPFGVHTAVKNYSLKKSDDHTLRFEIRPGDKCPYDGSSNLERSQLGDDRQIPPGQAAEFAFKLQMESLGGVSQADWFVLAELHNDDDAAQAATSPPIALELSKGDKLKVVLRHCPKGTNPSNSAGNLTYLEPWIDTKAIQRGQWIDVGMRFKSSSKPDDYCQVWINNSQVLDYHGPVGYGYNLYWINGLYRSGQSTNQAGQFRNLTVTI